MVGMIDKIMGFCGQVEGYVEEYWILACIAVLIIVIYLFYRVLMYGI